MHIAILAGEESGDRLGAPLMMALQAQFPSVRFSGIGGRHMHAAGLCELGDMQRLAVMGFAEVVWHLPNLLRLKKHILDYWHNDVPDLFIGIDAPDFNFRIEKVLHARGIPVVHYVSPSLWAWKEKRIYKIKRSVDLMLCLFPFEKDIYIKHGVPAVYIGHSMVDYLKPKDKHEVRCALGIKDDNNAVLGLFPGSRSSEISKILPIFLRAMTLMQVKKPGLRAVISVVSAAHRAQVDKIIAANYPPREDIIVSTASSDDLMSASDVLMLASGTITLEAVLLQRPCLSAYRVHPITAMIARRLLKIERYSLPNLLAGKDVINEWIQENCTPEHIANDALSLLSDPVRCEKQLDAFTDIIRQLPRQVATRAARAIKDFWVKQGDMS